MANVIKIKKGLDINLKGKAPEVLLNCGKSETYAVVPDNYTGIVPKVVVKAGDKVKAGSALMVDKNRPEIKFVSPVCRQILRKSAEKHKKIATFAANSTQTILVISWQM